MRKKEIGIIKKIITNLRSSVFKASSLDYTASVYLSHAFKHIILFALQQHSGHCYSEMAGVAGWIPREADSEMGKVFTEECPGINTCGREGRQHEWTEGETEL